MKVISFFCFIIFLNLNIQDVVKADPEKCYTCGGECKAAITRVCSKEPGKKMQCFSMKIVKNGKNMYSKSCMSENEEMKKTCNTTNYIEGGRCYFCDTTLCNSGEKYLQSFAVISSMLIIFILL